VAPAPRRVLDIGCGTGQLLRTLATRYPKADELCGLDPAPTMVAVAEAAADDPRLNFVTGVAEHLPYPDRHFDLVLATTSFDHWSDQRAGLAECARVAAPSGRLVLVDQFSILLGPTLVGDRRQKARLRGRVDRLLSAAGFASWRWHGLYTPLIRAVVAVAS
jgi:ubiquinone/menaquinone biosynthesis C-methylase UbiE